MIERWFLNRPVRVRGKRHRRIPWLMATTVPQTRQNRVSSTFLSILIIQEPWHRENRFREENRSDRRLRSDVSKGDISQMAFINCLKRYFETRSCRSPRKRLRVRRVNGIFELQFFGRFREKSPRGIFICAIKFRVRIINSFTFELRFKFEKRRLFEISKDVCKCILERDEICLSIFKKERHCTSFAAKNRRVSSVRARGRKRGMRRNNEGHRCRSKAQITGDREDWHPSKPFQKGDKPLEAFFLDRNQWRRHLFSNEQTSTNNNFTLHSKALQLEPTLSRTVGTAVSKLRTISYI